jgi:hypothetical protein
MKESQSTVEQAGKSLGKSFKQPHNSWWKVSHRGMLLPFAFLTAILRPSDPTNSGLKIILRISIFCLIIVSLIHFAPSILDNVGKQTLMERIEKGDITIVSSINTRYLAEDESFYYLVLDTSSGSGEYLKTYKDLVEYCEGFEQLRPETWCEVWDEVPITFVGKVNEPF